MTRSYIAIGLVGVALIIAGTGGGERGLCSAKETKTARRTPGIVAVLDVARLFKDSKQFKAEMEKMKGDVTKAETKVKAEREKLKSQREELEKLPAGSDERMKQEEEQNKLEAALEASVALQKKTFITREARVYLDSYKRMEAEVAAYAKQQGIDTVIRVAEQTADISNAQTVLTYINRPVVWYSSATDITSAIQARLDSQKAAGQDESAGEDKDKSDDDE